MLFSKRKVIVQADGIPNYRVGPHYDGTGAQVFVLEREFPDPPLLFRGRGRVAGSLKPLQPAQVNYVFSNTLAGLGGVQTGQFALTPLSDGGIK